MASILLITCIDLASHSMRPLSHLKPPVRARVKMARELSRLSSQVLTSPLMLHENDKAWLHMDLYMYKDLIILGMSGLRYMFHLRD